MKQINRYQILDQLGSGGMALVYRAYDPHFKREVAIKVMASYFLNNPQFRQRFSNEAQVIAALQHPGIVPVYDFGEENGQPYLVMALMQGGSLTERLQPGPLSLQETVRLLGSLAPALDLAHQKGIVHRDLKPDNILFDEQNYPYIADFGIAKLLLQTSMGLSQSGIGIGTPYYMSPEQARGLKDIDGRSDIYSLAVMAFYMLTGQLPYDADTPLGIAFKHISDPIPNIRQIRPDLPPGCETVMAHAMAKNPADRYATVGEMVAALDAVAKGTYQTAFVPATTGVISSHNNLITEEQSVQQKVMEPSFSRSARMISAVVGTILALILLIGIGFVMNSSPSEPAIVVNPSIDAIGTGNSSDLTQVVPTTSSNITVTADVPEEDKIAEAVTPDPSITMTSEVDGSSADQTATAQAVGTIEAEQTVTTEDQIATQTAEAILAAEGAAQATQTAEAAVRQTAEAGARLTAEAQQIGAAAVAATQTAEAQQIAADAAFAATQTAEAQRLAVAAAQTAEAQRLAVAVAQTAEAQRLAVAATQTAEAQRLAAEAEERRLAAVAATQTAEAQRLAIEAEQRRLAAVAATQTAEAQRLAIEAEQRRLAEEQRLAEERRIAEAATQTAIAGATQTAQARAITVFRVEPTTFVCGPRPANDSNDDGRIGIRLIPNDQNSQIQVELSKCNFTPFGKSGTAFIYIDGVQTLGPLAYSSGVISNHFNISPFRGRHSYQVYIYPEGDGEEGEPPHISGAVNAWDEVIYP